MKTRYKIILVIGIFILFYMMIPLLTQYCFTISDDCEIMRFMMNNTRAEMIVSSSYYDLGEWGGSVPYVEEPTLFSQINANIPFIQTMIIPLILIITAIILWDKRK